MDSGRASPHERLGAWPNAANSPASARYGRGCSGCVARRPVPRLDSERSASWQLRRGHRVLRRCRRRLSFTAEFCEHGFDLAVAGEAALGRRAQAAVDTGKFFRRRLVLAIPEPGIEFKCEFGKLVL